MSEALMRVLAAVQMCQLDRRACQSHSLARLTH